MHVHARDGVLTVELSRFGVWEAEHLHEHLLRLAPVSGLVLDFRRVTEFQDAAILSLAGIVEELKCQKLELRGVTTHQARLLAYLREPPDGRMRDAGRKDPA
jgi:hypothetical protein